MNIYKVFRLGKIGLFSLQILLESDSSLQISVNILIFSQSQFTKRINSFPFCFHLTNSFEMTFPVLNGFFFFVEKLMQGCAQSQ